MKLANRINRIQPSATLEMTAKASELRAKGVEVFNMSVGEPDFPTPKNIQKAGIFAIQNGITKYTPGSGTHELKKAIQCHLKSLFQIIHPMIRSRMQPLSIKFLKSKLAKLLSNICGFIVALKQDLMMKKTSINIFERATRECNTSPTIAIFFPFKSPNFSIKE